MATLGNGFEPKVKKCCGCGREYPATTEYFHRSSAKQDGLNPNCKPCVNAYLRNRRREHGDSIRQSERAAREALRRDERFEDIQYKLSDEQVKTVRLWRTDLHYTYPAIRKAVLEQFGVEISISYISRLVGVCRPHASEAYIYLAKNYSGDVKIGWSHRPSRRNIELNTDYGTCEMIFLAKVKTAYQHETALHDLFAAKRVEGEWYRLNEADIEQVRIYLNRQGAVYEQVEKSQGQISPH